MPQTKAERAAYHKQYYIDNREKMGAYMKQYHIDNPQQNRIRANLRYIDNKESIKEQTKQYKIDNPEKAKKTEIIGAWKYNGIIGDLSFIYDNDYLPATNCWVCNAAFKNSFDKCADHDHSITDGDNWRQILCRACNNNDSWKNHSEWV